MALANLQIVSRSAERPAHLVRIAVPRLNKNCTIGEYLKQMPTRDYDLNWAEVTDTRVMPIQEWNEFVQNLMNDREWLAGKGGVGNWDTRYDSMTDIELCNRGKEAMREWRETSFLYVVAVVSACSGQTIYIDPQGYNYARYVAFAASEDMPEGKTRAEIEREESEARIAARKARIAYLIANPPIVPPDHGLRFLWNGIKANGGELQKVYYSLGNLYDYPADTVSINSRDYHSFSKEVTACFSVDNQSDVYSDYHDNDHIRVCSNHPLYAEVKAGYDAQERHAEARIAKRETRRSGMAHRASA